MLTLWLITVLGTTKSLGDTPDDIANYMTEEELKQTGVETLSDTQRHALTVWLQKTLNAQVPKDELPSESSSSDQDGSWGFTNPPRSNEEESKVLTARIVGPFSGWSGKTIFHLDNDQVWKQRRSGRFRYRGDAREIEISKNRLGFFEMRLVDADRSIGVSRIK